MESLIISEIRKKFPICNYVNKNKIKNKIKIKLCYWINLPAYFSLCLPPFLSANIVHILINFTRICFTRNPYNLQLNFKKSLQTINGIIVITNNCRSNTNMFYIKKQIRQKLSVKFIYLK